MNCAIRTCNCLGKMLSLAVLAILLSPSIVQAQSASEGSAKAAYDFLESAMTPSCTYYRPNAISKSEPELPLVAVLVKGNGQIVPFYVALSDEKDMANLKATQEAVQFYEPRSQAATVVTLVDNCKYLWYVPKGEPVGNSGKFIDISNGRKARQLPAKYTLATIGGKALKAWPQKMPDDFGNVPSKKKIDVFLKSTVPKIVDVEKAHYMLALCNKRGELRVVYLKAADVIPFLWRCYKATGGAKAFETMLAEAHWIATNCGKQAGVMPGRGLQNQTPPAPLRPLD